jgi:hypothetical protein
VADYRGRPGCLSTGCLVLVCLFIPVIGHILVTVMILQDDLTLIEKVLWIIVVWGTIYFIGPFLYLLLGQRRNRLFGARPV